MDRGRVGEDRGSKETDRCPLTVWGRNISIIFSSPEQILLNTCLVDFAYLHTCVFSMVVGSVIKCYAGFYCWSGRVLV
jgi:hypothetical protein